MLLVESPQPRINLLSKQLPHFLDCRFGGHFGRGEAVEVKGVLLDFELRGRFDQECANIGMEARADVRHRSRHIRNLE